MAFTVVELRLIVYNLLRGFAMPAAAIGNFLWVFVSEELNPYMRLSIIVPMLNEAPILPALLDNLGKIRNEHCEVIFVDGGSNDGSVELAKSWGFMVTKSSELGRSKQMNHGALHATGEVYLFLHADTHLPVNAFELIQKALAVGSRLWGRFDVRISGRSPMLQIVSFLINWRSGLTGIATGDQAIFVTKSAFRRIGGFPDQRLMEDIELSRRLKKLSSPARITAQVQTSGRRWETDGVWRTIFLMWKLRWRYWLGSPADKLAKLYR